jgi:predicted TPR repeat methyltransferase
MHNKVSEFWNDHYSKGSDYILVSNALIDNLFSLNPKASTFLDLGCGTGEFMRRMEQRGLVATGVETSEQAIGLAHERGTKGTIYLGDLEEVEQLNLKAKFDLISLKLVIAFIKNRAILLEWCKQHLSEKGFLVVNTPVSTKTRAHDKPGIAVKEEEIEILLNWCFAKVEKVLIEETPLGFINTYVCSDL